MTDVYTPTANYRLVVAVDETDVRFAAHYGLKSDIAPYPKSAMNGSPDRVVGLVWIENMGHFVSYEQVLKTARANVR